MNYKFDIYDTTKCSEITFIESIDSMIHAEQRVLELSAEHPGKQFVIKPEYDLPEAE